MTLDEHARDALARYRASLGPSPKAARDQWDAISIRVEADRDEGGSTGRRRWAAVGVAVVGAAAAVVLILSVRPRDPSERTEAHHAVQAVDEEMRQPQPATPIEVRPVPAIVDEEAEAQDPAEAPIPDPRPPAVKRKTQAKPPALDPVAKLKAESRLVERARQALRAGQPRRALGLVDRHAREHRQGAMREEMALLRVEALCDAGEEKRWRQARARFDRRFPGSPLRVHLRQDCFE